MGSTASRRSTLVFARRAGGAAAGLLCSESSSVSEPPTWFLLLVDSGQCLWLCNFHGFLFFQTGARFSRRAVSPRERGRPGRS